MVPPIQGIYTVLALILLTGDPNIPVSPWAADSCVMAATRRVAMDMEIMDHREVRFVLDRDRELAPDIKLLRTRFRDLREAPPIADAMRLPSRACCNDALSFNQTYRKCLEARRSLVSKDKQYEYNRVVEETDQLYKIWDTVRDANCEFYYITVRRQALLTLKQQIGPKAYYSNQLPPFVPVWRFSRID